jgi:hypothetical protein
MITFLNRSYIPFWHGGYLMSLGRQLLTIIILLIAIQGAAAACYNSITEMTPTCLGGNISVANQGNCQTITCTSGADTLKVLACNKPDGSTPQYFEMYRQSKTGATPISICYGQTCISDNGYAKSPSYPFCTSTPSMKEVYEIRTGADVIELREPIGDVVDTITSSELPSVLPSGQISTPFSSSDFHQYLRLKDANQIQNMTVNILPKNSTLDDVMVLLSNQPFMEWEIQFPEGLTSEIQGTLLDDLYGRKINILGTDYQFISGHYNASAADLLLKSGGIDGALREGETQTITYDGIDYEVTLLYVSNTPEYEAKFSINGEITPLLKEGELAKISSGHVIALRQTIVNSRESVAAFTFGAKFLYLHDNNALSSNTFSERVDINLEPTGQSEVSILGQQTAPDRFEITSIKYRVFIDKGQNNSVLISAGEGVRQYMSSPGSLLSSSLDVRYEGIKESDDGTLDAVIYSYATNAYALYFTNVNGQDYTLPLLYYSGTALRYGDRDDDLVFMEGLSATDYNIGIGDYFVLSNDRGPDLDLSVSGVLRYIAYDPSQRTLEFEDQGTGATITVPASVSGSGSIVYNGHTFPFYVSNVSIERPRLAVDLNADAAWGDLIAVTTESGEIIKLFNGTIKDIFGSSGILPSNTVAVRNVIGDGKQLPADMYALQMSATMLAKRFDTNYVGDGLNWDIKVINGSLDLNFSRYNGPLAISEPYKRKFDLYPVELGDAGFTDYGTLAYFIKNGSSPKDLIIDAPLSQLVPQVFIVAETNSTNMQKIMPPFTMAIADDNTAKDVLITLDIAATLKGDGWTDSLIQPVPFSALDGTQLDNKVTLAIYDSSAFIIIGENSPAAHTILASYLSYILRLRSVNHSVIYSNQVPSADLKKLFITSTNASDQCVTKLTGLAATCIGGAITIDDNNGCRTIKCEGNGQSLQILACDKPTSEYPTHFEMYRQSSTGTGIQICLGGTTCIKDNGYAKGIYPVCTGNQSNTTLPPNTTIPPITNMTNTSACFSSVKGIPANCTGGTIIQDTFNGCRTLICNATSKSMQVLACDKSGFFEMYRQATVGTGIQICIGTTCIKDQGYAKSADFPICIGNSTVQMNTTNSNNSIPHTTNNQSNTATCYGNSTALNLPARCATGLLRESVVGGCRLITCTSSDDQLSVQVCAKDNGLEFSKKGGFLQSDVCVGTACLGGWGYRLVPYPICASTNTSTQQNVTNSIGNQTNATNTSTNASNTTQACFDNVANFTASCKGAQQIVDFSSGGCREIVCKNGTNLVDAIACETPLPAENWIGYPQSFKMNIVSKSGYGVAACLDTTCVGITSDFAVSPGFPACAVKSRDPPTNGTWVCYNNLTSVPITCNRGSLTEDRMDADGCRYLTCKEGNGYVKAKFCSTSSGYDLLKLDQAFDISISIPAPYLTMCATSACLNVNREAKMWAGCGTLKN